MKKILVAIDFSEVTPLLVEAATRIASAIGGHILLLNVLPYTQVPIRSPLEATLLKDDSDLKNHYLALNSFKQQIEYAGGSATIEQPLGSAVGTILDESKKEAVDIIVIGSHGHGAIYNLLAGSVTSGVLKSAKCPVLVVPSPNKLV